jgi:hypothetical protein
MYKKNSFVRLINSDKFSLEIFELRWVCMFYIGMFRNRPYANIGLPMGM